VLTPEHSKQYLLKNVTNVQTLKNRTRNKQNGYCIWVRKTSFFLRMVAERLPSKVLGKKNKEILAGSFVKSILGHIWGYYPMPPSPWRRLWINRENAMPASHLTSASIAVKSISLASYAAASTNRVEVMWWINSSDWCSVVRSCMQDVICSWLLVHIQYSTDPIIRPDPNS